jgi:DNA-binding CsgD family transcriptional regulator
LTLQAGHAIDALLSVVYKHETSLDEVLRSSGFDPDQTLFLLRTHKAHLSRVVLDAIADGFMSFRNGGRDCAVLFRRLGVDRTPATLREIGTDLELSHERIRQLETRAMKKAGAPRIKQAVEEALRQAAREKISAAP